MEDKELKPSYVASADDAADMFTKAVSKTAFEELRAKVGLLPLELEQKMEEEE